MVLLRPFADLPACLLISQWLIAVTLSPHCPLELPVKPFKHSVWVGCSDPTLEPNKSAAQGWGLGIFEKDPQVVLRGIQD